MPVCAGKAALECCRSMEEVFVGFEALVFLVWALTGFTAYVIGGWGPVPAERLRSVLTVQRVWALLAVTAGALVIVAGVIATVALPGECLYTIKRLVRSFAPQAVLGLLFGFGFAIWLDHLIRTDALFGTTKAAARIWGAALIVIFLGGIFMGSVNRLLARLNSISTSAVSLTFVDDQHLTNELIATTGKGVLSGALRDHSSATSLYHASATSNYFLLNFADYVDRDWKYVLLLHNKPSNKLEEFHKSTGKFVNLFIRCVNAVIGKKKSFKDPSAIQADFGLALAAGTAWLRSVLEVEASKMNGYTSLLSDMNNHLPQCDNKYEEIIDGPDEAYYKLPYFPLALAHFMQLAGHSSVGAELLANWIDRSDSFAIPDWYRLRAYAHFLLLFSVDNDAVSRHIMSERSVGLFETVFRASSKPHLRDLRRWMKECTEPQNNYINQLRFTFMTQIDSWVRNAIDSGQVAAALLPYVQDNEAIPVACYPSPSLEFRDLWRARFLTTSGALLVALDSRARATLSAHDDGLQAYRDARAYLVEALVLLRPLEEEESSRRNKGAYNTIEPPVVRYYVAEAELYLRRAEQALGIR